MMMIQYPPAPQANPVYSVELTANPRLWGPYFTHDPAVLRDPVTGVYYAYSTDMGVRQGVKPGIQVRRSTDLMTWEHLGQAIPEGIDPDVQDMTSAMNLWTPDVIFCNGKYRMYYAASTFGSQVSAILMAQAERPEGPFIHKGVVLQSQKGDPVNAISPSILQDPNDGRLWMAYGSFWGGIHLLELDPDTGYAKEPGFGTQIAAYSPIVHGAVEGPCLRYHDGYYYLFVSCGTLSLDYHVRVGRSRKIEGPYLDYNLMEMTDREFAPEWVGTMLLASYRFQHGQGWKAPGHANVFEVEGEWFLTHHVRPEGSLNYTLLQTRKLVWTKDGWPVVSPVVYAGESQQEIPVTSLVGHYERIALEPSLPQTMISSAPVDFRLNGTLRLGVLGGFWRRPGEHQVTVALAGREEKLEVLPAWDPHAHRSTLVMTGIDERGVCVWYKKLD